MRYIKDIAFANFLLLLSFCTATAQQFSPFSITVLCTKNPECIYDGRPIPLKVVIKNESTYDALLTVKYMRKRGPDIKIKNLRNMQERYLDVGIVRDDLLSDYQVIPPLGLVVLSSEILPEQIAAFGKNDMQIEAHVSYDAQWKSATHGWSELKEVGVVNIKALKN